MLAIVSSNEHGSVCANFFDILISFPLDVLPEDHTGALNASEYGVFLTLEICIRASSQTKST